jgi:hypothetical protein
MAGMSDREPVAWAVFDGPDRMHLAPGYGEAESCAEDIGGQIVPLCRKPMLEPDEQEALAALACYLDTRGNITLQAWGSLVRVLLARFT